MFASSQHCTESASKCNDRRKGDKIWVRFAYNKPKFILENEMIVYLQHNRDLACNINELQFQVNKYLETKSLKIPSAGKVMDKYDFTCCKWEQKNFKSILMYS
jgi:hypothetical protein